MILLCPYRIGIGQDASAPHGSATDAPEAGATDAGAPDAGTPDAGATAVLSRLVQLQNIFLNPIDKPIDDGFSFLRRSQCRISPCAGR